MKSYLYSIQKKEGTKAVSLDSLRKRDADCDILIRKEDAVLA